MSEPVNETARPDRGPTRSARSTRGAPRTSSTPTRWPRRPSRSSDAEDAERHRGSRRHGRRVRRGRDGRLVPPRRERLEQEGEIAADYLEELLEIADLDGDLDMDVEGDRATVSIVGADLPQLVGDQGEVLEALQELTRLAVYRETGERSRLMLDVSGHRARPAYGAGGAGRRDRRPGQGVRRAGRRWSRCRRSSARSCTTSSRPPA